MGGGSSEASDVEEPKVKRCGRLPRPSWPGVSELVDDSRRRDEDDEPGADALSGRTTPDEAEPRREKTGAWLAKGLCGSTAGDGESALGPEGVALVAE